MSFRRSAAAGEPEAACDGRLLTKGTDVRKARRGRLLPACEYHPLRLTCRRVAGGRCATGGIRVQQARAAARSRKESSPRLIGAASEPEPSLAEGGIDDREARRGRTLPARMPPSAISTAGGLERWKTVSSCQSTDDRKRRGGRPLSAGRSSQPVSSCQQAGRGAEPTFARQKLLSSEGATRSRISGAHVLCASVALRTRCKPREASLANGGIYACKARRGRTLPRANVFLADADRRRAGAAGDCLSRPEHRRFQKAARPFALGAKASLANAEPDAEWSRHLRP